MESNFALHPPVTFKIFQNNFAVIVIAPANYVRIKGLNANTVSDYPAD